MTRQQRADRIHQALCDLHGYPTCRITAHPSGYSSPWGTFVAPHTLRLHRTHEEITFEGGIDIYCPQNKWDDFGFTVVHETRHHFDHLEGIVFSDNLGAATQVEAEAWYVREMALRAEYKESIR